MFHTQLSTIMQNLILGKYQNWREYKILMPGSLWPNSMDLLLELLVL